MFTATYSPEDNKLRLYVGRVPREDYEALRAAGFVSTPKQTCDFVATWTPEREDLAREFLDDGEDIGDEDYSPQERAADRAERFDGYRDKRAAEAGVSADTFDAGPSAFGHQNRARAERQARRHDRHRTYAVSQWSKAEYWHERTAGVIANALYKSSPAVRRSRILRLEADERRAAASVERYGETAERSARWLNHYRMRLEYERAMLAAEGGSVADADMEPGGWICTSNRTGSVFTDVREGWKQIQGVNKSPATGRVVSVKVWGTTTGFSKESGYKEQVTKPCLVTVNIQRLPEGAYRPPTDEERAAFKAETKARKAEEKAKKPAALPLINPTDADAAKLQEIWNERAREYYKRQKLHGECPVSQVIRMTQAEYSARSKGAYGHCKTSDISELLQARRATFTHTAGGRVTVFKLRTTYGANYAARPIIILTDKPQTPIPWARVEAERAKQPTEADIFYRLPELIEAFNQPTFDRSPEAEKLIDDAAYVGWAYRSSATQRGLTEEGAEAWKRYQAMKEQGETPTRTGTLFDGAMVAEAQRS